MSSLSLIVAVDSCYGIGKNNQLPWYIPGDLKHFKDITTRSGAADQQNAVIMGRRTWESLPDKYRPLPGRLNVVLSHQQGLSFPEEVKFFSDINLVKTWIDGGEVGINEAFIIGGAQIYRLALEQGLCSKLYITSIEEDFHCDTFIEADLLKSFRLVSESEKFEYNGLKYRFLDYLKI